MKLILRSKKINEFYAKNKLFLRVFKKLKVKESLFLRLNSINIFILGKLIFNQVNFETIRGG
jgi:hypothetical protein